MHSRPERLPLQRLSHLVPPHPLASSACTSYPPTDHFILASLHCSLPFCCLLTKQTPTLSMSLSQFKAAKGLGGGGHGGWCVTSVQRRKKVKSLKKGVKINNMSPFLSFSVFFRVNRLLKKPDLHCHQVPDLWKKSRLTAEILAKVLHRRVLVKCPSQQDVGVGALGPGHALVKHQSSRSNRKNILYCNDFTSTRFKDVPSFLSQFGSFKHGDRRPSWGEGLVINYSNDSATIWSRELWIQRTVECVRLKLG